ncbi:MAG TPA: hypothetical protein VHR66_16365 [Gemmataceae bacterium]|jgi:hypothetical protein|nr:hypothetical protein [Gemmataceae bacterium]
MPADQQPAAAEVLPIASQLGNAVEPATPQSLLDNYDRLSNQDVDVFLQLLGERSSAAALQIIIQNLPTTEHCRFRELAIGPMYEAAMPLVIQEAIRIVRAYPDMADEEIAALIAEQAPRLLDAMTRVVSEVERARLKAERDPKPRKTERDDEIVRLYDEGGLSFGEIPARLLLKDKSWGNKDGSPLQRDTVEKAYHRRKGQGT